MTTSEVWDEETAAKYDADVEAHFAPEVLDPTVDLLERLAEGGPVAQLRSKVSEEQIPVLVGDMATTVAPGAGTFGIVFLVWNSISNLRTHAEQVECFRNAAHHLQPGGRFVIDLWVPPIQRLLPGEEAVPMSLDEDHLVFDTYDLVTQQCASHHYHRDSDGSIRYGVGHSAISGRGVRSHGPVGRP